MRENEPGSSQMYIQTLQSYVCVLMCARVPTEKKIKNRRTTKYAHNRKTPCVYLQPRISKLIYFWFQNKYKFCSET